MKTLNNILIRKAKFSDCKAVYNFGKAKELRNPNGNPPRRFWIDAFVKEKQIFYVAEDIESKNIVGFILAEKTTGDVAIFHELFVEKNFRKHGIGKILMKTAEKDAKSRGVRAIILYGNQKVSKFLKKGKYEKGLLLNEYVKFIY